MEGHRGAGAPPGGLLAQPTDPPPPQLAVVGVALKKDKRRKHISDRLIRQAAEAGVELRFVDKEVPLERQGPFVAILQKVRKPEWEAELVRYAAAHPEVQVFDMPAATYPLRNRGTMVSFLDGEGWEFEEPAELVEPGRRPQRCRCNVPTNTTLPLGTDFAAAARQLAAAGLQYPLLAKPLWADGREGSHALAVVHTPRGLQRLIAGEAAYLQLPIMLQQYVDHGGCLFKVYVLGDTSVRVKRNSLHLPAWTGNTAAAAAAQQAAAPPPAQQQQQQQQQAAGAAAGGAAAPPPAPAAPLGGAGGAAGGGALPDLELMERVSAYPATKSWGRADTAPKGHGVPSPPAWLLQALAQRLRSKTGLSLFNFDVIVPMEQHRRRGLQAQQAQQASAAAAVAAAASPANGAAGTAAGAAGGEEEPAALDLAAAAAAAAEAAAAAAAEAEACGGGGGAAPERQQAQQAAAGHAAQQQAGQQQAGQQQAAAVEEEAELLYHLIDINYFPGYEKMPNYEEYMVQFLRSIVQPSGSGAHAGVATGVGAAAGGGAGGQLQPVAAAR